MPWSNAQTPHVIEAEQGVPAALPDVFRFFSDAKNLERLTPPFLNFPVRRLVRKDVGEIFRFRRRVMTEIFGS